MSRKKIVFLTGTRADFGKIKPLISVLQNQEMFETHIFVTGMHLNRKYGFTGQEVVKCGFGNIFQFINHDESARMDKILAKTIEGFSDYVNELAPDLIVVHGDRVEAMAGALVGSLNNILVAHIEGGELSGTVDELIRHAVSKLAHLHLVANDEAAGRLLQMGEKADSVFVIGSPDIDVMTSKDLPDIEYVKKYYEIPFESYAILMFHPVTTEVHKLHDDIHTLLDVLIAGNDNYVVIFPNNDTGSEIIIDAYEKRLKALPRFKIYPSMRFEKFLTLMKHAQYMIGNSSAGIREAPFYDLPSIDVGTRQHNRGKAESIFHVPCKREEIEDALNKAKRYQRNGIPKETDTFGDGKSAEQFLALLKTASFWDTPHQKQFQDMVK